MPQPVTAPPVTTSPFRRDRFTWTSYLMLGYYSFILSVLGPLMPFLRAELKLDYTLTSFHFSAFALGTLSAAFIVNRLINRFSRRMTFWGGGFGLVAASLALIVPGNVAPLTLLFVYLMGVSGGTMIITLQAALSDHHLEGRGVALTEANIVASFCAILAPLAIGGFEQAGVGWRVALILFAFLAGLVFLFFRSTPIPEKKPVLIQAHQDEKLPAKFWVYWLIVVFGVCTEISMTFWASDFLEKMGGLELSNASLALSLYFCAMLVSRIVGSRLIRRYPAERLILVAVLTTALGFPLFWLAAAAPLKLAGLFIVGLGIANFYPITLVAATGTAPAHPDLVSARISSGASLATLSAPFILGWLAGIGGIQNAYGIVVIFLAIILSLLFYSFRSARQVNRAIILPEAQLQPVES